MLTSICHKKCFAFILFVCIGSQLLVAKSNIPTWEVFKKYSNHVVKIQVLANHSVAQSSVGSGFFVSAKGHIITNYHVVSEIVLNSNKYHGEVVSSDGHIYPLRLIAIDVLHDLALVKIESKINDFFVLDDLKVQQGERLLSLGHPHDIGLSIVEGTYNDFLKFTRFKRIHFTGSINGGMSGGPAILNSGKVVGINVSSAGNQVSFLVPVKHALNLYQSSKDKKEAKPDDFIKSIRDQLYSNQDLYYQNLLKHSAATMNIGEFNLTNQLSSKFKCWGDLKEENEKQLFTLRSHTCFSRDDIYISKAFITNKVEYQHLHISTGKLNRFRFFSLLSKYMSEEFYQNDNQSIENQFTEQRRKLLTNFKCQTATIDQSGNLIRTVFCLRAYKLFEGLYDAVFKTVPLDQETESVISTLYLPSISFDNSQKMAKKFLSEVSWTAK